MTTSSTTICVWPDGYWCIESEVDSHEHRDYDYHRIIVPDNAVKDYAYIAKQWHEHGQYAVL